MFNLDKFIFYLSMSDEDIVKEAEKAEHIAKRAYLDRIADIGSGFSFFYKILIISVIAIIFLFFIETIYNFIANWIRQTLQLKKYKSKRVHTPQELRQYATELSYQGEHHKAAKSYIEAGEILMAGEEFVKAGERIYAARFFSDNGYHIRAAQIYSKLEMHREAAQEYSKEGNFSDAASEYLKANMKIEAARLYEQIGCYKESGAIYESLGLLDKAMIIYNKIGDKNKVKEIVDAITLQGKKVEGVDLNQLSVILEEAEQYMSAAEIYIQRGQIVKAIISLIKAGEVEKAKDIFLKLTNKPSEDIMKAVNFTDKEVALKFAQFFLKVREQKCAAQIFDNLGRYREAAQLAEIYGDYYYAGQMYQLAGENQKSAVCMERAGAFGEAGFIYESLNDYEKAGDSYLLGKNYLKAIQCYKKAGNNIKLVEVYKGLERISHPILKDAGFRDEMRRQTNQMDLGQAILMSGSLHTIQRANILSSLNQDELARIYMYMKKMNYNSGENIIVEGNNGVGLFIIEKGRVAVRKRRGNTSEFVELGILSEGDHFGEISALYDMPATANVVSIENCTLLFISSQDLKTILIRENHIGYKLYSLFSKVMAERLASTIGFIEFVKG